MTHKPFSVGIIGCGNIAEKAYAPVCQKFPLLQLAACADLDVSRAQAMAKTCNIPKACSVEDLLADPSIDLIINLTIPKAHAEIDCKALNAGKHVYSEKPFAVTRAEGEQVVALAKKKNLRVGCAPDTVMGCGVQTARKLIDDGIIGKVVAGHCFMQCGGHETWHPSPEFYYEVGGGPVFDMGPYYLHALITLLGPIKRVSGAATMTWPTRTITSQPKNGKIVQVEIPTHVSGVLEFVQGAVVTFTMSFDIKGGHHMPNIELYGTDGSMQVPDPNGTNGPVLVQRRGIHNWTEYQRTHPYKEGARGVGIADMAVAIRTGRDHRANERIAMHALDAMVAIHDAAASGQYVTLTSTCERPAPMRADLSDWTLED